MPTGNMPSGAKSIYERVYKEYRDKGMSEEEAAKRAWGAVKNAGYSKGKDGAWHKKAELSEFSFTIRSVGLNKQTGERYWKASTSDIFPDSYNDEMTLGLYKSFIEKIEGGTQAPEQYRSESWQGGLPYVSVSHYREHSIAGDTSRVYVDGTILKANGTFRDTPLGRACFDALWDDVYGKRSETGEGRIRVSIAFLDFKHQHKATGNIFVRSDLQDTCPECIAERREGRNPGKRFLEGLLVHFAMTRVPVNERTLMEVEKSMTTRKEDAESIVGSVIAEELEEKERSLVGKSEAEVIRSEDETEERSMDEDEDEEDYRPFGGATTLAEAKSYIESGKEQRRIGDIWFAFQACLSNIASGDGDVESKSKSISALADEFKGMVKDKNAQIFESLVTLSMDSVPIIEPLDVAEPTSIEAVLIKLESLEQSLATAMSLMGEVSSQIPTSPQTDSHPLSVQLSQLRSDFDQIVLMDAPAEDRLRSIQPSFEALGEQIRGMLSTSPVVEEAQVVSSARTETDALLISVIQKLSDKIDLMAAQNKSTATPTPQREVPRPRSIPPAQVKQQPVQRATFSQKSTMPVLSRIIDESVGLKDGEY